MRFLSLLLEAMTGSCTGPSLERSTGGIGRPGVLGGGVDSSAAGEPVLDGEDKEG
jgi:hypothetical protein